MAKEVILEMNDAGMQELLKSEAMQSILQEKASAIAKAAGPEYKTDIKTMGTRVIASVYTEDEKAIRDNLKHNTLLKAVSSA